MAVIISSDVSIESPNDAPYVPDLDRSLWCGFNMQDYASIYVDGNTVLSVPSVGSAEIIFDKTNTSGVYPTYSSTVTPHINFNGTQVLGGNVAALAQLDDADFTVCMLVRIDATTPLSDTGAGIVRGASGTSLRIMANGDPWAGALELSPGSQITPENGMAEGEWGVLVVAFSDSGIGGFSWGGDPLYALPLEGASITAIYFGHNSLSATAAQEFGLARFAAYDRVLSNDEIAILAEQWTYEAGL